MLDSILHFFQNNALLSLIGITCLIQITPIKVNPWSALMKSIKKYMTSDVINKVNDIQSKVEDLEGKVDATNKEIASERVQRVRWNILNFTYSCRREFPHTKEEWDHCIDEIAWYESYCKEKNIINGVIDQSSSWLKQRYHQHLENDDFLTD